MICVKSQILFITELNPEFIRNGFFVAKIVGILFQNKENIPMVVQGSQTKKQIMIY